jgi:hypothetical protein
MTSSPSQAATYHGSVMQNLKWSGAEKAIARKAFDLALKREFEEVVLETRSKAAKIHDPSTLWNLERYLTKRRQEIDSKYDYRYSVLPIVFGRLVREGRLSEKELHGLGEDKMDYIRRVASL